MLVLTLEPVFSLVKRTVVIKAMVLFYPTTTSSPPEYIAASLRWNQIRFKQQRFGTEKTGGVEPDRIFHPYTVWIFSRQQTFDEAYSSRSPLNARLIELSARRIARVANVIVSRRAVNADAGCNNANNLTETTLPRDCIHLNSKRGKRRDLDDLDLSSTPEVML